MSDVAQKTLFDTDLSVAEAQEIIALHGNECVNAVRDAKTRITAVMVPEHTPEIVRLLIERGANVNHCAKRGLTPLMTVQHAESARLLVEAGAQVDARDMFQFTALLHSIQKKTDDKTRVLLEHGADANKHGKRNGFDVTAVGLAGGHSVVTELLVSHGADVNVLIVEDHGATFRTPLHDAFTAHQVQLLVNAGAKVDALDHKGNTPLRLTRDFDVACALVKAGANPNARNQFGRTPLHRARTVEWIKMLVDAGANGKEAVDSNNRTPLIDTGNPPRVRENLALVQAFVEIAGVDVNSRIRDGGNALEIALYSRRLPCVQLLVELGASVDTTDLLKLGARHIDSLRFLLACGADVPSHWSWWVVDGGMDLLFAAGCRTFSDVSKSEAPPEGSIELERARQLIRRSRVDLIRKKATSICIGLQAMDLPAWVMLQIVECASSFSVCVPLFLKWKLVTTVKHFGEKKQQQQPAEEQQQ